MEKLITVLPVHPDHHFSATSGISDNYYSAAIKARNYGDKSALRLKMEEGDYIYAIYRLCHDYVSNGGIRLCWTIWWD